MCRLAVFLCVCALINLSQIAAEDSSSSSSSESSTSEADNSEQITPTESALLSTVPYAFNLSENNCSNISVQILCRKYLRQSQRITDENTTTIHLNDFLKRWNRNDDSNNNTQNHQVTTGFEEDYHSEPHFKFAFETENKSNSDEDWRAGLPSLEQRNKHLLNKNILTDCTFEVGTENNSQIFHGHMVFFARASPIFEAVFNNTNINYIKIEDISPKLFEHIMSYAYSGSVCLTSFSEACDLLHTASRLQLPELAQYCRAFLWTNLYPSNVWRGYQCAQDANDDIIKEAALQIIEWKTDDAMKDPAFTEIPQSTLVAFLARDDLNVSSEVKLYEASLRWAISEASRRGLPQEPESLRQVLGNALGLIRFLTFTPSEFANIQSTSKILTYGESMSVIFNLNSPGVIPMPLNLTSNKKSRDRRYPPPYFKVIGSDSGICERREENIALEVNTFDLYTSTLPHKHNVENLDIIGAEIPTQIHCRTFYDSEIDYQVSVDTQGNYYTTYDEDLTIYIIKNNLHVVDSFHFQGKVKCNSLVTVNFTSSIPMYVSRNHNTGSYVYNYKIKVILHTSGRYPLSWSEKIPYRIHSNPREDYIKDKRVFYWYFADTDFVYSIITNDY